MPAGQYSLHAPLLYRVEYFIDRRKVAFVGCLSIAAGAMIAYPPAAHQALLTADHAGTALVALAGAVALLTVGFYLLTRMLLWRGPAVVIDGNGIHDRRHGAVMTPWRCVRDIRALDRYGHHIGIDTAAGDTTAISGREPLPLNARPTSMTIIDTYFLRSATGDRVLDFVMPLTAMTPIDMSDVPVSEQTLSADAQIARNRMRAVLCFILAAAFLPGVAALVLATV